MTVFTSAKEPAAVSAEVMRRGMEFLKTEAPGNGNPAPLQKGKNVHRSNKAELPEAVKKVLALMENSMSVKELDGKYLVESSKRQTWYLVDLKARTCDCTAGLNEQHCWHIDCAAAYRDAKKGKHK